MHPFRNRSRHWFDEINELRIHSVEEGSGPPLVFLHGWSIHAGGTRHVRHFFRGRYRTIAPTLIGFRPSAPLPHPAFSLAEYGDAFASWLDRHDLKRVTLVGHSLGGAVAIAVAARAGERLARLIVIDALAVPIARSDKGWAKAWLQKRIGNWRSSASRTVQNLDMPLVTNAVLRPKDLSRLAGLAKRLDARAEASRIRVPTLILWGDADEYIPRTVGEELHRIIPDSQFRIVHGDHDWPILHPERLTNVL